MKKASSLSASFVLTAVFLLGGSGIVRAIPPAESVKYRQDVMDDLKDAMKALKHATKAGDGQGAAAPAAKLQRLTKDLTKLFPPGSTNADSEAKPEVWSRWADFEQVANDARVKAEALAKAASSGDSAALQDAMRDMGSACKACHKDFRSDK